VTIEFTNATPAKSQSTLSVALLVASCLFFFVPATLIVLGYYSSLPTGSLISPLPQGIISNSDKPEGRADVAESFTKPIIAAPDTTNDASSSANTQSNATQKSFILPAGQQEISISDPAVLENSQIYLISKEGDKSLYTVKSKTIGQFIVSANAATDTDRPIDYQTVNP